MIRNAKIDAILGPYEFPCTECGGDAFVSATRWRTGPHAGKIGEDERLCIECGRKRGVPDFFRRVR